MTPREHERRLAQLGQHALSLLLANPTGIDIALRKLLSEKCRSLELVEDGLWGMVPTMPDLPPVQE